MGCDDLCAGRPAGTHEGMDRREFLTSAAALPLLGPAAGLAAATGGGGGAGRPCVIASGNGLAAVTRAMAGIREGEDPVEAVVAGVAIVEDDPDDMTVGYGGLPNEDGVVQLDASVMHGPTHKAGAVGALENVRNAAKVALEVLRRTDHVMLVGDGALKFARAVGFEEQDMLTDAAREAWLKWKAAGRPDDDWLDEDQQVPIPHTHGTIHVSAVDAAGDLSACTTTSGLSYKLAGRVGDSPIVGAGMFVDNEVGSAGATGRGEAVIQSAGAFQVVRNMADGMAPTEACLAVLKWIADHTHRRDLLDEHGHPNFGVTLYALRKDGAYGSATMSKGGQFAVIQWDGVARHEQCAVLFESSE